MTAGRTSVLKLQALLTFEEITRGIAGLHTAKGRIEGAIYSVANQFESVFRDCPLVLYPQNRGRGKCPFGLYWNWTRKELQTESSHPFRRSGRSSQKTRSLRIVGPLTDDLIHRAGRWGMRDTLWDFDRRAAALNTARHAVARALDRNLKSLRYRLPTASILVPSSFPDRPAFAIPPYPDNPRSLPEYTASFKAALRYVWVIAHRLAFAGDEYQELCRRYQSCPAHPEVSLEFPEPELASPDGSPVWRMLSTGALSYKLSHAILRDHGFPRGQRHELLKFEKIRRKISRSTHKLRNLTRIVLERTETATLAFDRGLASAQVMLPRMSSASRAQRNGAPGSPEKSSHAPAPSPSRRASS